MPSIQQFSALQKKILTYFDSTLTTFTPIGSVCPIVKAGKWSVGQVRKESPSGFKWGKGRGGEDDVTILG